MPMYDDLPPEYLSKSIDEFVYVDGFDGDPKQYIRFERYLGLERD